MSIGAGAQPAPPSSQASVAETHSALNVHAHIENQTFHPPVQSVLRGRLPAHRA